MDTRRRRVVWTQSARSSLEDILAYIAKDSPTAASRALDRRYAPPLDRSISPLDLTTQPRPGRQLPRRFAGIGFPPSIYQGMGSSSPGETMSRSPGANAPVQKEKGMPTPLFVASIATAFLLGCVAGDEAGNPGSKAESPARIVSFLLEKLP